MKPREELEELLGLDIPPAPEVSLAGITTDSVLLYYKPLDIQTAPLKLSIQVNGIKGKTCFRSNIGSYAALLILLMLVGEFNKDDTSVQITGLRTGNYYSIRVLATNAANFTTPSSIIRLRTIPPSPRGDGENVTLPESSAQNEPAVVYATSTPFQASLPSPATKEQGGGQHQTKRVTSGRRNSPAVPGGEQSFVQSVPTGSSDEDESPETIQRLTERLNFLRAEKERVDREIAEEEEDSRRNIVELTKERDRLKQEYKEREEASSELRRHGNHLDKVNRTAQSRKAAKEKQLQQKKAERQKLRDDIARYERETIEMRRNTEAMRKEKEEILATKDRDVAEIRKGIAEDLAAIKLLEEEIRVKGAQIKVMEKEQERMSAGTSGGQEQNNTERESDQAWEARMQIQQAHLGSLWQSLQQAQKEQQQAEEHLAWWMAKRARNPEQFAPIPSLDSTLSMQRSRSRRSRQQNSRTSTISSPSASYQSGSVAFTAAPNVPPPFPVGSHFFNMGNGTTAPAPPERLDLSQADLELPSSGGPMSPTASNLLPSNLFRDDDIANHRLSGGTSQNPHVSNTTSETFQGHTITGSDTSAHGFHTPGSTSSRPGSIFSSSLDNPPNMQGYQSRSDQFMEGDQQSINSVSAAFNPSIGSSSSPLAGSRLADLFSSTFYRQRGKPVSQEPPLLGTLKQGQSQSFPRNVEQDSLDSNEDRRRRGSHGNWGNPVSGLLTRNSGKSESPGLITARTGSGRRSRLNMFAPKVEGLDALGSTDHPSSSRPSSTYSYDQMLTRPSSDSQRFGWPAPESGPSRSSPLGTHWSWAGGPWSHAPSRRPSVQHGSTSNLSIGSTPLDPECPSGSFSKQSTEQAPIGTRPQSSQHPVTPRLNPAAPTFKTLFTRADAKKSGRGDKSVSKGNDKARDKDSEQGDLDDVESLHESSPQNPRRSRDAQSVTTAASTADSHESFDRSTSGTPSEVVTPSGPKETLMQKITRKSSSSKFNVPWAKERSIFSKRAGEPSTPGEMDIDAVSENQLGKSAESSGSTPQQEKAGRSSISWPNIRRKSKKGDQILTEAVEGSSEVGDGEES